nr:DUF1932 domain-containing protein [Rhizobium sp. L1K21]
MPYPIAFVGFGEAAQAFAAGWRQVFSDIEIVAYDIKTDVEDAAVRAAKFADYEKAAVRGVEDLADGLERAMAIFSLVTADQAHEAAKSAAKSIRKDALYFDCNSCAPGTKRRSADIIEAAGGRYVDIAVMSPVHPKLHKTPLLTSGPHSEDAVEFLSEIDMSVKAVDGDTGRASSMKMIRSVMVKGLEALVLECVLSGTRAGVADEVLDSLEASYPGFGWKKRAAYMMERALTHGPRRAAEMREVALTVQELGFSGGMATATADWEELAGNLGLKGRFSGDEDYAEIADAVLAALSKQ